MGASGETVATPTDRHVEAFLHFFLQIGKLTILHNERAIKPRCSRPLKSLNRNSLELTLYGLDPKVNRQLLDGADLELHGCAADGKCRSSVRRLEPQARN